jgi:hypothetical protein
VTRVRKLLGAFTPGLPGDAAPLRAALAVPVPDSVPGDERLFVLGWAAWLDGDFTAAEGPLAEAADQAHEPERRAEAAYWCARVRLRLGRAEALPGYEALLRTLGGSPQATAWFVDLLWRAGRVDRAEQVWKSLCGNRRITACPEAPLLEARALLRREEMAPAERVLAEAEPVSGVVWVECVLLRAWVAAAARGAERARELLARARQGPYPATALQTWAAALEHRLAGVELPPEQPAPVTLAEYLRGQEARSAGDNGVAADAYRTALARPAAAPFARYAMACLGLEDPAAVLAAQPGMFLALRCRARIARERFRRREITPGEFLDATAPAETAGYRNAALEHFRRLADVLRGTSPIPAENELGPEGGPPPSGPQAANLLRAALEVAVRRLPPAEARPALLRWSRPDGAAVAAGLGPEVGRQLLRLALLARESGSPPAADVIDAVAHLLPDAPLLALARDGGGGETINESAPAEVRLLGQARRLADDRTDDSWRDQVRALRGNDRLKGLAQALLAVAAARRQETAEVVALLEETEPWRRFGNAPPRFVVTALLTAMASRPSDPSWRRALGRWLRLWDPAGLGVEGAALASWVGLGPASAGAAPPGVPAAPWFLHLASRALARDDAPESLACVRQAINADPNLADTETVRDARPELESRAGAARLAAALAPGTAPALLVDAVALLAGSEAGRILLAAVERADAEAVATATDALAEAPDLPPRLAHHLALLDHRAAAEQDDTGQAAPAVGRWRRAWRFWLRLLAAPRHEGGPAAADAGQLLDHLLAGHRRRVNDRLARAAVDDARRHWNLVQELPTLVPPGADALRDDLTGRVERFREELATEYLVSTREAMRYGDVPEGWRADYTRGLDGLRRLLSLDRDNVRLLTALVEVCTEWFLDLYHQGDVAALREQAERFTPLALQLARLAADRPGDLAARAAVAEYWKFRGFVSRDRAERVALYHEALRFNPANANVRDLLAELEPPPPEGEP